MSYVRVSTDERMVGPDVQRAALEQWCTARNVTLAGVFTDHGLSGGAPLDERPGLLAALAALALKCSRGERTGGIPYGYRLAADGVHLQPCRTEQRVSRMVRRYHGRRFALRRIAARLQPPRHVAPIG